MRWLVLLPLLALGCGGTPDRPLVVVGFSADPAETTPGRVMVAGDGVRFSEPIAVGEPGDWLVEVAAHGAHFSAIGLGGGLYESDVEGARWTRRALHDRWLDAIHYPAHLPGMGWLSGVDAVWDTADGGRTFGIRHPPGVFFEALSFRTAEEGVAVEGAIHPASGAIWRTEDGGRGWTPVATANVGIRDVARPDPEGAELWAVGDAGLVVVSTDGGLSWADVSGPRPLGPVPDLYDVDFAERDGGWIVGSTGVARAWRGADLPAAHRWTGGRAGDFVLQGVHAESRDEAWACGYRSFTDRGVVLHTRDGGRTWRMVAETPGIFWYAIDRRAAQDAGGDGG